MPPMSQTVYSSSLTSHLAKEFQAREAQEIWRQGEPRKLDHALRDHRLVRRSWWACNGQLSSSCSWSGRSSMVS
jgi:hypothetical protein